MSEGDIAQYNVIECHDLDNWQARPGHWDTRVIQLSREPFSSCVRSITFPDLVLYRNQLGGKCLMQGEAPPGWVALGGVVSPEQAVMHYCGHRVDRGRFCIASGGSGECLDYSAESGTEMSVLLVSHALLRKLAGEEEADRVCQSRCMDLGEAGAQLIELEGHMLSLYGANSDLLSRPEAATRVRSTLLLALEECFPHLQAEQTLLSRNTREEVVYRAVSHARQSGKHVSAWEMAQAAGVCRRTLEFAFRQIMGITPGQYLIMARLSEAHHALARAEKSEIRVTDIANDHGFTHVGRFSQSYKKVFGELPSQTLSN